jgi:HEPN domain-containing protein
MDKKEKYRYWLMLSNYDIETIDCLIEGERWVYVAYLCQQAMERQLKGMFVYYNDAESPKTHNLNFLFTKVATSQKFLESVDQESFDLRREEIEDFLVDLMFYYMSDYPFSYRNIMNRFVKEEIALDLFQKTLMAINWLRGFQPEVDVPRIELK